MLWNVAFATVLGGCSGTSFVEGTLSLGEHVGEFEFAEVRAFPPHSAGFSVRRIYDGEELLEDSIVLGKSPSPITFRLEGYDIGDPGGPWRMLAWLTNREHSTWVGTHEPYGTRSFAFDCANGPACAVQGVDLTIDNVAPPN